MVQTVRQPPDKILTKTDFKLHMIDGKPEPVVIISFSYLSCNSYNWCQNKGISPSFYDLTYIGSLNTARAQPITQSRNLLSQKI